MGRFFPGPSSFSAVLNIGQQSPQARVKVGYGRYKSTDLLQQFASDNYSGICPQAWAAMEAANHGHVSGYGDDPWTAAAADAFRELFETDCEVFFAFNGTAANSLVLASLCQSYHAVICCQSAHVETDECGAPEFFSNGSKILTADSDDGKLTPAAIHLIATKRQDIHYPKPRAVTISQSTETGRVYTVEGAACFSLARVRATRAAVTHGWSPLRQSPVPALAVRPQSLPGKAVSTCSASGALERNPVGEAILFFDRKLARDFDYRCKQAGQLASKMRFLAAPWVGMLNSGAWLSNAAHADECAGYLADQLAGIRGVEIASRPQANAVFVQAADEVLEALRRRGWKFYTFIGGAARFMCSWDTDRKRIDEFCRDMRICAEQSSMQAR